MNKRATNPIHPGDSELLSFEPTEHPESAKGARRRKAGGEPSVSASKESKQETPSAGPQSGATTETAAQPGRKLPGSRPASRKRARKPNHEASPPSTAARPAGTSVPEAIQRLRELSRRVQSDSTVRVFSCANAGSWKIHQGDALTLLRKEKAAHYRLVILDPPQNVGIDYGQGASADQRPIQEYLAWYRRVLAAIPRLLTPDGSLFALADEEVADYVGVALRATKLPRRRVLSCYESSTEINGTIRRSLKLLYYHVVNREQFVYNCDPYLIEKDVSPFWYINEDDRDRIAEYPAAAQVPAEYLQVIRVATHEGDWILDPFAGSMSTGMVAIQEGRGFVGIEQSERYVDQGRRRLEAAERRKPEYRSGRGSGRSMRGKCTAQNLRENGSTQP